MATQVKTTAPQPKNAEESTALIMGLVARVAKSYAGSQGLAQDAAMAILNHAKTYSDCSKAPLLVRALPARERNSMIGWFGIFSPIRLRMGRVGTNGKVQEDKVYMAKSDEKATPANRWGYRPFDLAGAAEKPWFTDPAEANPIDKPLDTLGDFEDNIRKRLKNAADAARAGKRFIPTQKDNVVSFAEFMIAKIEEFDREAEKAQSAPPAPRAPRQPRQAASA